MKIRVFYQTPVPTHLRKTRFFKNAAELALKKFAKLNAEVNLIFVSKQEILRMNKAFLNHHYVTDVISFNHPCPPCEEGDSWAFGDVYVCYPVARENAPRFGHTFLQEMAMYSTHGALHLAGMNDDTPEERAEMDLRAEAILNKTLPLRK